MIFSGRLSLDFLVFQLKSLFILTFTTYWSTRQNNLSPIQTSHCQTILPFIVSTSQRFLRNACCRARRRGKHWNAWDETNGTLGTWLGVSVLHWTLYIMCICFQAPHGLCTTRRVHVIDSHLQKLVSKKLPKLGTTLKNVYHCTLRKSDTHCLAIWASTENHQPPNQHYAGYT
jgi:hypothetical protein